MTVILGGSGGQSLVRLFVLGTSGTWSPPWDCKAIVTVIGSGGGGASQEQGPWHVAGNGAVATGGGAGGLSQSYVDLKATTTYTLVIGAGGTGGSSPVDGPNTSPTAGSTSSFAGSGITTLTANGGAAGNHTEGDATSTLTSAGVAGGSATGGTLQNNTGGGSGAASVTTASSSIYNNAAATGGGAIGLGGTGYSSGTVHQTGGASYAHSCNGGAGTGGGSANTSGTNQTATGGGATAASTGSASLKAITAGNATGAFLMDGDNIGVGTNPDGCGGDAVRNYASPSNGGFAAGGGGMSGQNTIYIGDGAAGGIGGGGGGTATAKDQSVQCHGGNGGTGVVIVEVLTA